MSARVIHPQQQTTRGSMLSDLLATTPTAAVAKPEVTELHGAAAAQAWANAGAPAWHLRTQPLPLRAAP